MGLTDNNPVEELPLGTVDGILAAPDLNLEGELFPVPEWQCSIKVRGMTKREQIDIRNKSIRGSEVDASVSEMLTFITCVVEPKFQESHYGQLIEKSAGVIDRVLKKAMSLSGANVDFGELKLTFRG